MFGLLASSTGPLLALGLLFLLLVGGTLALESDQVRALLRRYAWYRRFELLPPSELRFRGLVSLGTGVCCFAALLTLKLFVPEVGVWSALALGMFCVVAVTLGAALLERAAYLEGLR